MQDSTEIKKLTKEAQRVFAELNSSETDLLTAFDRRLKRSWQFGVHLNKLKSLVPHGDWATYRDGAFKGLDDRTAQQCQKLARENPNAQSFADLSAESVRKFRFSYVPAKERPQQKGDKQFARPANYTNVENEGDKLMRRVQAGHEKVTHEMLAALRPLYDWLTGQYADAS